ncbi:MAG: recombinase family protein, partial [Brevinema sp.]
MFNDSYSRDISQKIKGSKQIKRINGDFVGSFTVYGYKKCSKNKNKLEIDKEAAAVVADIFAMKLSGLSALAIANRLNVLGVVSPLEYKKSKGIKMASGFKQRARSSWSSPSVTRILKDETYTGT